MNASSLEFLEKCDLPAGQARAILKAVDTELTLRGYATKEDLKSEIQVAKAELRTEIQSVKSELLVALAEMKRELEVKIEAMGMTQLKWCFLFWITGIGTLFTLFKWLK